MTLLLFVGFRIEKYVRASNPWEDLAFRKESIKSNPYRFSYFKFSYELNIENSMPCLIIWWIQTVEIELDLNTLYNLFFFVVSREGDIILFFPLLVLSTHTTLEASYLSLKYQKSPLRCFAWKSCKYLSLSSANFLL